MQIARVLFILLLLPLASRAEYRVFTVQITNSEKRSTKQFETTLDPEQYAGFYPLQKGEQISYVGTWRCPGRTDFLKPHCAKPDRGPASLPSQSPEIKK